MDLIIAFVVTGFLLLTAVYIRKKLRKSKSSDYNEESLLKLYKKAVSRARVPSKRPKGKLLNIIDHDPHLEWKIINGTRHVKMITWTDEADDYTITQSNSLTIGNWNIWVVSPKEIKQFGKAYLTRNPNSNFESTNLRIKQLLGLPYQNQYNYFIEFWVKPEDLFRPSHNPDITSSHCEPIFHESTCPKHKNWIEELQKSLYDYEIAGQNLGYPWTQLGYTYDWSAESKDNVGITEFCVKHDSTIQIEKIHSTESYFRQFNPIDLE